jgi:hypothetical protein
MAHIASIGAGMFSDMAVATPATDFTQTTLAALDTAAEFQALFATEIQTNGGTKAAGSFVRMKNVREFPSMGTPPNIVNVPVYGSKTSQQIQGQSDAPSIELTVNYVPADWASGTILGSMVGDGKQYVFRFALLNAQPLSYASVSGTPASGIGSVQNSQYYWVGKVEALQVNPQLTDANTATITISIQSQFFGAYTE